MPVAATVANSVRYRPGSACLSSFLISSPLSTSSVRTGAQALFALVEFLLATVNSATVLRGRSAIAAGFVVAYPRR